MPADPTPAPEPLRFWLTLDALDREHAVYVGANEQSATIDRAEYEANGRPQRVTLVLGDDPESWCPDAR